MIGKKGSEGRYSYCRTCCYALSVERFKAKSRTLEGRADQLIARAKTRAKALGVPFSLTKTRVLSALSYGQCEVTRIPFSFEASNSFRLNPYAPSIDRIKPNKGYTDKNIRVVVNAFNVGRGQWGDDVYKNVASSFIKSGEAGYFQFC